MAAMGFDCAAAVKCLGRKSGTDVFICRLHTCFVLLTATN